jgi:cellulose 1,4-beta-cellobiosidase
MRNALVLGLFVSAVLFMQGTLAYGAANPPTNVKATAGTYPDKVVVTWTAPTGTVTTYNVYRNTTPSGTTATKAGSTTAKTFNDIGGQSGTKYYYFVSAVNSTGESTRTVAPSVGWRAPVPAKPPTNVVATGGTYTNKVVITWTAPAGTVGSYNIYRDDKKIGLTTTAKTFTDTGAEPGTPYYYSVAAVNSAGESTHAYAAKPGWIALAKPANVLATDSVWTDKVRITWGSVSNANYYQIYRGTTTSVTAAKSIGTATTTTYDDTTAVQGTKYYYWVLAKTYYLSTYSMTFAGGPDQGIRKK